MLLKNRKVFISLLFVITTLFSISCSKNKLKISTEDLENCAKWNWIALSEVNLWTPKGEAFFTYVPTSGQNIEKLSMQEVILCGTWESVYLSSYFSDITARYKLQYKSSDIKGKIYFCKNKTGYLDNKSFSKKVNSFFNYRFAFEWKLENCEVYIKPIFLKNLEDNDEYYEFKNPKYYFIGELNLDNKYMIQVSNWNFNRIQLEDSFLYHKYGIKKLGNDCIRYKYTWIEDWGEPILKEYIKDNDEYSLEELESMSFYK